MDRGKIKTSIVGVAYISMLPIFALFITSIPLNSNTKVNLQFLNDTQHDKVLMFGGFPECSLSCPTSLSTLRQTYIEYLKSSNKNDLGVIFVNIRRDTPQAVSQSYVSSFHPDFDAYSTTTEDTKNLYTSLGLQTFPQDSQNINHQGRIYFFHNSDKHWRIKKVFNSDVEKQTLLKQLNEITS